MPLKKPSLCRPLHVHLEALLLTICGLTAESRTLTQIVDPHTTASPSLLFLTPSSRKTASATEVTEKVPDQSHHSCRLPRDNGPGQPHCISAPAVHAQSLSTSRSSNATRTYPTSPQHSLHECRTIEHCPLTLLNRTLRSHVLKLQRKIA